MDKAVEIGEKAGRAMYEEIKKIGAKVFTIITLRPITLINYANNKPTVYWFHADVIDSFKAGLAEWAAMGGTIKVTGTLRTISQQTAVYGTKGGLKKPGWSMHGHGRAVDVSNNPDGLTLPGMNARGPGVWLKFYEVMARHGWWNIKSFPGKPMVYPPGGRERWHVQRTDPPGMFVDDYMRKWAEERGGIASLKQIGYTKLPA